MSHEKPESVEKSSQQNAAIESLFRPEVKDDNVAQVNPELQGKEATKMIDSFMTQLASADRNGLKSLLAEDSEFKRYTDKLASNVFGPDGKVKDSASVTDLRKLLDVNNALIHTFSSRATVASSDLNKQKTMATYNA